MERTAHVRMTEDEWLRQLEHAAKLGAEAATAGHGDLLDTMRRALLSEMGFVDRATLAEIYDTSVDTIAEFEKRHGLRRVDGPDRRRIWYDLAEVRRKVLEAEK